MAKELYTQMGKEVLFKGEHFADAVNQEAAGLITGQMQKLVDQTQSHDESQDQIIKRLREENQIFRVGLVAAESKSYRLQNAAIALRDDMIERAEINGRGTIEAGNGAWLRFIESLEGTDHGSE